MSDKNLIVITGASSGIGAAMAKKFSQAGHPLLALSRRLDKLQALNLKNAICKQIDVTNYSDFSEAVAEAEKVYGSTDCLINNAGVMFLGALDIQPPQEWKTMFEVNVLGVLNGIQIVLTGMKKRKTGTIFNMSSLSGRKTMEHRAAYCGSKFAVHAISETLREEVSQFNIRVMTIAPGAVDTELINHTTDINVKNGYVSWKRAMDNIIKPDDIARAVLFAYEQPQNVCMREIIVTTTQQKW